MLILSITPLQLRSLLEDAAQRGIQVGKKGTDTPLTAAGIASVVYAHSGLRPTEQEEKR
jgi:hypothetical protein